MLVLDQHQVGTQAIQQLLAIPQVGHYARLDHVGHAWQQLPLQLRMIGAHQNIVGRFALVEATSFIQKDLIAIRKYLGCQIKRVQAIKNRQQIVLGAK
ncbi:hypothetical protein PssB301D_00503 [Pseudomonas syringae pv. syringae str. B301D-R]|nr:hypothetical protein PssB301D_00503 [Pseudomonas syringae pv. syringae str. B301D-R]